LKDTIFIIVFGVLIYLGFSTILGNSDLMGSYGSVFASYNHLYFGYVSYIYILLLLIPLYYLYKNFSFTFRKAELTLAMFLLLFSSLLIQAMLVKNEFRGKFAGDFVDFLSPYIGVFGLWVFYFIITSVSIIIILDKSTQDIFNSIVEFIKSFFPKKTIPVKKNTLKRKEINKSKTTQAKVSNETITESQDTQEEEQEEQEIKVETSTDLLNNDKDITIKVKSIDDKNTKNTEELFEKSNNILDLVEKVKEQKSAVIVEELEENAKLLETIEKGKVEKPKNFKLPSTNFLQKQEAKSHSIDETELDDKIRYLIEKLAHFKIDGDVVRTYAGPVVSTFEFKPAANVKVSKILNLQDDLAMALSAETIRIQAPIPGKDVVGIEIPNDSVETIYLREILDSKLFKESSSPLTIALGKDIVGKPFITDLKKLPHLLIAGTTGSGKSVGINAMILSLLYKNSPDQLRLLMIDPKMLEFSIYNDIPHLLTPVITKPKQAIVSLNNMVNEMERRYELMAESRTKNIENYNEKIKKDGGEHFPYIVVIIDELSDLMMTSGKDVEISIARLAQKSRACGIHLIVATQRPSVDVVTGLIKANLPSRISYRVGQKIDSKIILDQMGAESLLGRGDMLFTPPGAPALVRLHAPWATEDEIENIVEFIKSQREPNYDKSFLLEENENVNATDRETYEELDPLYEEARNVILNDKKTSISYLQRKLQIGYNRSARVIEQLEAEGVLSAPNNKGIRTIL
jgi:S-DNA-T family DNA segregation ATPase FtsK/SpoIIIE